MVFSRHDKRSHCLHMELVGVQEQWAKCNLHARIHQCFRRGIFLESIPLSVATDTGIIAGLVEDFRCSVQIK